MPQDDAAPRSLRIEPLSELPDDVRASLVTPIDSKARYGERSTRGPNLTAIMAHNPGVTQRFMPLSIHLAMAGMLPPRDREIAVMRVAWLDQLPFVWGEHVRLGKLEGISTEEVERITRGSAADGWSSHDAAILRAVEELHESADITDATWNVLAQTWSEGQLVELPMLVGAYKALGYFQAVVRYPLWEGNPGLAAR